MDEANERKGSKYADLVEECCRWGWRTWCELTEVDCRGLAAQFLYKAYSLLGITCVQKKKAI